MRYGRLIDIGREIVEELAPRSIYQKLLRKAMLAVIPYTARMSVVLGMARVFRPLLPAELKKKIPAKQTATVTPVTSHARRMLVLEGCVQPLGTPNTNAAAARVFDRLGISLVSAEAIVMTASGCGLMVKDYGHALKDDAAYADKAARISALTRDLSEVISGEIISGEFLGSAKLETFARIGQGRRVAYHSSCTLQHGQKLGGMVETILRRCGYELTPVADSHLCCGAAGSYTLLQAKLPGNCWTTSWPRCRQASLS